MELRQLLETKKFVRIPLKKLATGHYKITIKVNQKKGSFIVDTGASSTCIGLTQAPYFNLAQEISDIKASGAGATNMFTKISKSNHIKIQQLSITKFQIILFDLSHVNQALNQVNEAPVDGIIGADFLKQTRAVIDYGRNCMYIKY